MAIAPPPTDLGGFPYGEYVVVTMTFGRNATLQNPNGTPQDPSVGPFCKLTPPGGVEADYTSQLTPQTGGAFKLVLPTSVSDKWTGRIYSTGPGQTSRDIVYVVADTWNP